MSLIIAAPSSGSGKTTITLGLLRALSRKGVKVRGAKSGPDYIDPAFHAAACGTPCFNMDAWAMSPDRIKHLAAQEEFQIIEGAMGLFDGAPPNGKGATADLARMMGLPVVLVVDATSMSHSVAPLVKGFAQHDSRVQIAGIILNKVGSPRHEAMLRSALADTGIPVLGALHRTQSMSRPSRHLGLVQAGEMPDLEAFLDTAADTVESAIDLNRLLALGLPTPKIAPNPAQQNPRTIALAQDAAFSFTYAHHFADWAAQGATVKSFSPLADHPVPDADEIILPGGYPELYAGQLASNTTFLTSLKRAAKTTKITGECGGYMVLGEVLTDAEGSEHKMAGLLALHTSFETKKLHLGYRNLTCRQTGATRKAHEFHYATTLRADGTALFDATDAEGSTLPPMGLVEGNVSGSFAHIID